MNALAPRAAASADLRGEWEMAVTVAPRALDRRIPRWPRPGGLVSPWIRGGERQTSDADDADVAVRADVGAFEGGVHCHACAE